MLLSIALFSKTFEGKTKKEAYFKAMNWVAKNIVHKQDENKETSFKVEELKGLVFPSYKITLFCSLNTAEEENRFCENCKKYHKSFFINQDYNCSSCKHKAFMVRMHERLKVKRSYRRDKLKSKEIIEIE